MQTKIKCITVVNQQGISQYLIGHAYEGMVLARITDCTVDSDVAYVPIFRGYTKENSIVFEVINAPIEVIYMLDINKD
jgi:hypothetical protein